MKKTFKENQSFDVNRQWLIEKGIEHGSGACLPGNAPPPRAGHLMMALAVLMVFQAGCTPAEKDLSVFQDITRDSGLAAYEGMTHGAAWGDYDGDGRPDLYLTNHLMPAALFRNLGGGRFEDVSQRVLGPDNLGGDKHGAAWADFDNDGDLDLVQLTSAIQGLGEEPKHLFVNLGDRLVDQAAALGVDNLPGRTRMPLWVDLDRDGKLDLFQGAEARHDTLTPPFVFARQGKGFADMTAWLPLLSRSAPFCVLTALDDDPYPEIVCRLMGEGQPNQLFDTRTQPARTLDLLPKTAFEDVIAGDFDNDGRMDLFLARKNPGGRVALAGGGKNTLTAQVELTPKNAEKLSAFRFRAQGGIKVILAGQQTGDLVATDVRYGGGGILPGSLSFEIGAGKAAGMPKPAGGERPAVLIGNPEPGVWQVEFHIRPEAFGGKKKPRNLSIRIQSDAPIEAVEALGDSATDETAPQRLFMNRDGKLVEEGDKRGVNERPVGAANAVAADFDNDMDLDIFVLGTGDAGKAENLLLLNDGKGHFDIVRHAGGAAGLLVGVGDSATTADVDGDGFLDLLTASGASMGRNLGLPSDNGRYQLFRNVGNGNHWLMVDLVGTRSNRGGIGARVVLEAGGVSQTRFQDGGIHERGQNHARLHFGLGKHAKADKITVHWPSGKTQTVSNAKSSQVIRLKEPD